MKIEMNKQSENVHKVKQVTLTVYPNGRNFDEVLHRCIDELADMYRYSPHFPALIDLHIKFFPSIVVWQNALDKVVLNIIKLKGGVVEMDILVLKDNKHSQILILVIRKRMQFKTCLVNRNKLWTRNK